MTEANRTEEQHFEVGEVAVGQNARWRLCRNGMECVVTGALAYRRFSCPSVEGHSSGVCYKVRWADGDETCAWPDQLRKRRPPQDWVKLCRLNEVPAESEGVPA
jgi:hypothetical protein